jgi:signal recognition particle subunit SRP72
MQLTYETAFNLGCYFASLGEWERSVGWLELARGIGRKALQDDSSGDDQLQQDLATIAVELAYVYQKQGRKTEAAELCHDILRTK